ncbi:hypothetical protein ABL78_4426 [Leptomonas seymouri]|uniref:Uncharacterized protein n=1 Tax=Leptomonas seymouri TaxID=5684 RepID=A0A0N1IK99_LEPSE|nr:hypothetical protein ABL78_4426 [Leptomonas seymouri]|eukprot:KPI86524.1 hypothetical protein ABL78_4426 [Leptomonas seymouri]
MCAPNGKLRLAHRRRRRHSLFTVAVAFILCMSCVSTAMIFSTANVQQASMYQTIQLDLQSGLQSNPRGSDPVITTGDLVYFIDSTDKSLCVYSKSPTNTFPVTVTDNVGYTGRVIAAITPNTFSIGKTIYPCYLSVSAQTATVVVRGFVPSGESDTLTVWPAIYTEFATTPAAANGGEGPVHLKIVQSAVEGRAINRGLTGRYTVLLIPCGTKTGSITSDCKNPASLVDACNAVGTSSAVPTSVISLSRLSGQDTGSVTGSFVVPYAPNKDGYYICVPYCYSTAAGCGGSSTAMSYTVVFPSTKSLSAYVLSFGSANPGIYTRTPTSPQAREVGFVFFSGNKLSTADSMKAIRSSDECTSTTASLITNFEHGDVEVVSTKDDVTHVRVHFVAPDLSRARVVGKVCYYHASSGLWSTAYLSASDQRADFTIDVLQPTGFTIKSPPSAPTLGETLTIVFDGTGLDGSADSAYLSASTSSDPCSMIAELMGKSTSALAAPTTDDTFSCTMSGGTTAPTCKVTVDPVSTNLAMTLRVCYRKGGKASEQTNFAEVRGTVSLGARNPTYAITPYPFYAGQSVSLVFTGVGLSASDTVQLVKPGSVCGDQKTVVDTATLSSATEVNAGTSYSYILVGAAETCIMVCYQFAGSSAWIVARSGVSQAAVSPNCEATNIYISAFPVRYTITNLATSTSGDASIGSKLTVAETATMRFSTISGQSFTYAIIPTAMRVVQVPDSCVMAPCGTAQIAACAAAQKSTDYTTPIRGAGGISYISYLQVNTAGVNYIVCVETASAPGVLIPVLPSSETSTTSGAFGFTSAPQNPTLTAHVPPTWRVSMNTLTSTFTGTALNAATNVIYAVGASALQALYTTADGTTVAVCPPVLQTPSTILVSSVISGESSSTSVRVRYTRADQLYDVEVVYLCYAWSAGKEDSHITMAGTVTVGAAIPSSMVWVLPEKTSSLRAGHAIKLSFTSNLTSLSAAKDAVYFYRFTASSNPNPNCYCDPTACATGTQVSYSPDTTMTGSTTGSVKDDTTTYSAPRGFDNYNYPAVFIICYKKAGEVADTYMGRVTVAMANPTHFTLVGITSKVNRVGAPINITAVRRCLSSSCEPLSLSDSLRLVPSSVECADLTDKHSATTSSVRGTIGGSAAHLDASSEVEANDVQAIGVPVVDVSGLLYMRRFVVDTAGNYRVCYRLANRDTYSELVFSSSYVRTYVEFTSANPKQYTPVPAAPSAGQFLTIDLTCSAAPQCSACTMVRIVPGERASCWEEVDGTYRSDSCLTVTSVQFPDEYLVAGSYTVCYGDNYYTSRRIPTWLTVAEANPSSFTPTKKSGDRVYTNQDSDYTLDIAGKDLKKSDTVFLLPNTGFSCHDLRTGSIQSDGKLASWLEPSVEPYPLALTSTGVSWVVSNHDKRFGTGLLYDTDLCPGDGAPCGLKLCYMRDGTSWAPVPYHPLAHTSVSASPPSSTTGIELVASILSSVEFDRYPLVIGMYVMATVAGNHLESTDTVSIHDASCSGTALTVSVKGAYVNPTAAQWVGVLRVTGAARRYAVCHWRAKVSTEIINIKFKGQASVTTVLILSTPLYYMLSPLNFTSATTPIAQYEQLVVGGSFTSDGVDGVVLTYVEMISADTLVAECNYEPFQVVAGSSAIKFPVVLTLSEVLSSTHLPLPSFEGRLNVAAATYALCMNAPTGLFRAVATPPNAAGTKGSATALTVHKAAPGSYTPVPTFPMPGQKVTLTFSLISDDTPGAADVALEEGDAVQIISGTLYECGFPNATVIAHGLTTLTKAGAATTTVTLDLPMTITVNDVVVTTGGKNYTVCYRRKDGSFATSPIGSLADVNLHIMVRVPLKWTALPTQAQVEAPISITFYGDSDNQNYLEESDTAFLVPIADGATPDPGSCFIAKDEAVTVKSSASSDLLENNSKDERPVIRKGTMTKPDSTNTQWDIPAGELKLGAYIVCYVATRNGEPVYVSTPDILTVYPTQSPSGAYIARSATLTTDNLKVMQGERVYLLFVTTVDLNVVLDNTEKPPNPSTLAGHDVVRITKDSACSALLTTGVVDAIPSEFGYAALGLHTDTGLTIPYLHLRIRADVGNYYVCMRRTNRKKTDAYYNFEVVGGLHVNPAVLVVAEAPIAEFTTDPEEPWAWMPHTNVTVKYGSGFSMSNIAQFFFVSPSADGGEPDNSNILHDPCYRPNSTSQTTSSSVPLVNQTLNVFLASPMFTQYSFGVPGTHLLCYEVEGNNIASVYPSSLKVHTASPTSYEVPSIISVQNTFTMTFTATVDIFTSTYSHVAQIYKAEDSTLAPNCTTSVPLEKGTTHFTSFKITSATVASVDPLLFETGFYFVCFVTYTKVPYFFPLYSFPVPNAKGSYKFAVDIIGAQSYTVAPQPAYMGQVLHLIITGNSMTNNDRVKVFQVSLEQLSDDNKVANNGDDYTSSCTAEAANADASEPNGAEGSKVSSKDGLVADYYPRVNETGTFILCYQSAELHNGWTWVPKVHQFTVGPAHPTHYTLSSSPPFETEVFYLSIHDSGADSKKPTDGILKDTDQLKLVDRGTGGFDCTAEAKASSAISLVSYISSKSNSNVHVYRLCGSSSASVTVCYALSTSSTTSWAEVPLRSPPPTFLFAPAIVDKNPFAGPFRGVSRSSDTVDPKWVAPRPYEPFTFFFTSAIANLEVLRVAFADSPAKVCAVDTMYVPALHYKKQTDHPSAFEVVLPHAGTYAVLLGPHAHATDSNITHHTPLVVGECDPCHFTPNYALVGGSVSLSFPSSVGGSLSNADEVRIFPVPQGLNERPCDAPKGPYAGVTLKPVASSSTSSLTVFTVSTGTEQQAKSYLGEYYVCYRKASAALNGGKGGAGNGNFAVVAENDGTASIFSIYPSDLLTATVCPSSPMFALETAVYSVTAKDTDLYPNVNFAAGDQMVIVPSDVFKDKSGSGCASITNVDEFIASTGHRAQLPTLDTYGRGHSNWHLTFASQSSETSYVWCFKMFYDSIFRDITPSAQSVLVENPYKVITSPPVVLPDSTGVQFIITGTGLASKDDVYIVPESETCAEMCFKPLTPKQWTGTDHKVTYVDSTTVTVSFSSSIGADVTLGVCYRRAGRYLTRLTNVYVGEPNPTSYTVSFVPRVGTRPTLTFKGTGLSSSDAMMIVKPEVPCLLSNAVAKGTFVSVSSDAKLTKFDLILKRGVVEAQGYTVCYRIPSVGAYVVVSPVLTVVDGLPAAVVTSNKPMCGRATVLSVADPEPGDDMYIACPGCSCYDLKMATVPYGSVSGAAKEELASNINSKRAEKALQATVSISIRVGFNETQNYPVCYRRSNSGYAQIGGLSYFVTPVVNSPIEVVHHPAASAQYQGQRLNYKFSTYSAEVPLHSGDVVMLVKAGRECWDNVAMEKDSIVVGPSALTGTDTKAGVGEWATHVPSLGPHVPADASKLFPLSYVLCYSESSQSEYVSVPFKIVPTSMAAADPSAFSTEPAAVEVGILGVKMSFTYAVKGQKDDQAYIVQFTKLTDGVCDDAASTIVAARGSAYPSYTFSLSSKAVVGTNTAVCYIRTDGTVAELPQLLKVVESNPSGYTTSIPAGGKALTRQYIEFTIHGTDLNTDDDSVVFTHVPCAEAAVPLTSSPYLARLGDPKADGATYVVVTQFIASITPISIYVCYHHNSVWRQVGSALQLNAPQPSTVTFFSTDGSQHEPRAGQHISLVLNGGVSTKAAGAAVLSARTSRAGTWCHNFTKDDIQEKSLEIQTPNMLSVPVWETAGEARLCILNIKDTPWADVAATVDAASISILPANPSEMSIYPSPPRVGQSVTLKFHLLASASAQDAVKITKLDYKSCKDAEGIPGLAKAQLVTSVVDKETTTVTLVDSTDTLAYRSFNTAGSFRVCYFSNAELSWSVVGGSLAAGTITVEEQVPKSWSIASGSAQVGMSFSLAFHDDLGLLQPAAEHDLAWAAPSTMSCGHDPHDCETCIIFDWDKAKSSSTVAVTLPTATVRVGKMNLCYRLYKANAALVPGSLSITTGPVECVQETSFVSGQHQKLTFRLQKDTDVKKDTWRLSFFATTALDCQDRYVKEFVPGLAVLQSTTSTSATYSVVWPVGLGIDTNRYTLCFDHNGVVGSVCTCGQIDANTGECFISATPGSPQNFTQSPEPTYVGQAVTLTFAINQLMTAYPPKAIKFVSYVDELTSCDGAAAFTPANAVLSRISDTSYTYVFKHDYKLGSSTLLVCALTDLSTSYGRVASTIEPSSPKSNNTLWIRPYLKLSNFPSSSDYLREMETLKLTFTMESQQSDDLVSAQDFFTFVDDPANCVESYIASQDPAKQMSIFEIDDSAFLTLPANVMSADAASFTSQTLATFAHSTAGTSTHFLCYKLATGTYAPVLPGLKISEALFTDCSVTGIISPSNGDKKAVNDAPSGSNKPTTNNGGSLRAMFYAPTSILGTAAFAKLVSISADAVRVVPQNQWCMKDAAVVFTTSVVATKKDTDIKTLFFASLSGTYKVCYRFGDKTNWSPACMKLAVTDSTPTGETTGCWNEGQTVQVKLENPVAGHVFTSTDHLRFIDGKLPCLQPDGSIIKSLPTVTIADAMQQPTGLVLSDVKEGQKTYALSDVFFRTGTTAVRLCYTDAAGNEFAIAMNHASSPGQSLFSVQARQPTTVRLHELSPRVGQRLLLNFSSAESEITPQLVPYGTLPHPFTPGPPFKNEYDGATMLAISSATAYTDGRCAAALRAGKLTTDNFLGVYGSVQTSSKTNYVPYTIGSYIPTVAQHYIVCYQLAKCGAVDSGSPFRVDGSNPSNVFTVMSPPRRGQLINVYFDRDKTAANSEALTPGSDRAVKQADLSTCWALDDTAGTVVEGTPDRTSFTTIIYAQTPGQTVTTSTRSCYRLASGSWSEVPNGVADVLPANPVFFETLPASARVDQVNYIRFHGNGLSATDRVKIITQSKYCSDDSVPPTTFAAYTAASPTTPTTATSAGWTVMETNGNGTTATLNFTASATGTYSVCYRLAADTVWTLVYSNLVIYEHNPVYVVRTPVTTLEGELFTLDFNASTEGTSDMSANDHVVLYYGNSVNCADPTEEQIAPSVVASPSRTDLLPRSIAFQMSAGTRGDYTICYRMASSAMPDGYITIWGYDAIVVKMNPAGVTLHPIRSDNTTPAVYRAREVLTYVFEGWALVATAEKTDQVKLITAPPSSAATDAMCQKTASAPTISYYDLHANGTYSVQMWRASSAAVGARYAVCYKLNGGQYHVIGDPISIASDASPDGATSPKLTDATTTLSVGESMPWTLTKTSPSSCVANKAIIFYSDRGCSDVPYYVDISAELAAVHPSSSAAFDALFPTGAAIVSNCGAETLVRVSSTYVFPTGATSTSLSVCYWSDGNGAVSLLSDSTIALSAGQPPVLTTTLSVSAQEVFTVNLAVVPTALDWVVLVEQSESCVGVTAPTNDAYFSTLTYDRDKKVATVTAALPNAGLYHVCYSHPAGACAADTERECARVVGTVAATASNPGSWSGQPSPVYVTNTVAITMTFSSSADAAAQGKTATAWLAPIISSTGTTAPSSHSMIDVWFSCQSTRKATSPSRHDLTYISASGTWAMKSAFTASGSYALCYTANSAAALHLFGPIGSAGPVVQPSTVTTVRLPASVTVSNTNTMVLTGGGLSTTDSVVAVAVPKTSSDSSKPTVSSSALPDDICTNKDYTPRINAVSSSTSAATSGLSTMLSSIVFTSTGEYVLCYTATHGGTTEDESASNSDSKKTSGTPVLITSTPFSVVSSVISMTVLSPVLEVGVPLTVLFSGNGMSMSNNAALIYVGDTTKTTPTVATVCQSSGTTYTAMQSINAAGTTATYVTTPSRQGLHMMCFRPSRDTTPILMPAQLNVDVETAVSATFSVQPGGCTALMVCTVQPTVTLLNSSDMATSAPYSTVLMKLYMSDGKTAAPDGYLANGHAYSNSKYTNFTFYALRISVAGNYVMRASVTLASGTILLASSSLLTVADSDSGATSIASVVCRPLNILNRAESSVIDCMISSLEHFAPSSYTIVLNEGTPSAVVRNGTSTDGLPTYQFSVTPPAVSTTTVVNYITLVVTPASPYESWLVTNSPVTVRLTTAPSSLTTLECTTSPTTLPLKNMIRVGSSLQCGVQGIIAINGVAMNIVAPPDDLSVTNYYNGDSKASTPVDLGTYPTDVNGRYSFTLKPSSALNTSVEGTVRVAKSGTPTSMVNSPLTYILIGVPTADASTLACASTRTGSTLWYAPAEPLSCTATLANTQGSVNGLQGDYAVILPDGGSVTVVTDSNWGPTLVWSLTAPPQPSVSRGLRGALDPQLSGRMKVETLAAAVSKSFGVQVRHTASGANIGTFTGSLVYVTSVAEPLPTLEEKAKVSMTLVGVGLETTHRYTLGTATSCASVQAEANAMVGRSDGTLVLTFTVPSSAFLLCFGPADARTSLQSLMATRYTPVQPSPNGTGHHWTGDDLAFLIIGVIFLFILLVLLVLLLWCIFCYRDDDDDGDDMVKKEHRVTRHITNTTTTTRNCLTNRGTHVYMPPRANTRYVLSMTNNPPTQSVPLPIEAPPSQQQQQQPPNTTTTNSSTRVRVNIHDTDTTTATAEPPVVTGNTAAPPPQLAVATASPFSLQSSALYSGNDSVKLRHRHHSHRSDGNTTKHDQSHHSGPGIVPRLPASAVTSASRYIDLDRPIVAYPVSSSDSFNNSTATASRPSLPPLPPPPLVATMPALSQSVTLPPAADAAAPAKPATLPLPQPPAATPAPPAPDGLVKSPQRTPPPQAPSNLPSLPPPPTTLAVAAADRPARTSTPMGRSLTSTTGDEQTVGPFRVVGHTSTPMVRSPASSRHT